MKNKDDRKDLFARQTDPEEVNSQEGYPLYPPTEDIYSKYHEEKNLDPDRISQAENSSDPEEFIVSDASDIINDMSDNILGDSGLELDDYQENIGLEDEENNYYSLGGDDHLDLEEEQPTE